MGCPACSLSSPCFHNLLGLRNLRLYLQELCLASPTLDKRRFAPVGSAVRVQAPAKINLSLIVFGRRDDGWHDIHTVIAAVNLYDDLHLSPAQAPGIHLRCTGRPSPAGPDNLVHRAAELMARHTGMKRGLDIHLHKRIPAGAGLGGGSSDAAACLLGLNQLWQAQLETHELTDLASQLGSDVPFFIHGPSALCTGRGEVVQPLRHHCRQYVLLIMPPIHSSTASVYANYKHNDAASEKLMRRVRYFLRFGDMDGLLTQEINSLCDACCDLLQELRELRNRIQSLGIEPVHLAGSGSCLFVTSPSSEKINMWAEQIEQLDCEAEVQVVRFEDRAQPYVEVLHGDF